MKKVFSALLGIVLIASMIMLTGCPREDRGGDQGRDRQDRERQREATIRILNTDNEVLRSFTIDELRDLDETTVTVQTDNDTETLEGPTLATVLDEANVSVADRFIVNGTLNCLTVLEEEAETSILDFTNGSVRLAGRDILREQWVTNVNQIIVQRIALRVTERDQVIKLYTIEELRQLTDTTVTVSDGETRTVDAVRISTLLDDADVDPVNQARVAGEEREVSLSQDEIQISVLFIDENNRIGFVSPAIERNRWPEDVTRIEIVR